MKDANGKKLPILSLKIPKECVSDWHGLLRRGVKVCVNESISVRDFMTDILKMDLEYATNSVPGLFVNNTPVDDWIAERVYGGDDVGMSGTMPGLCGIALRRSSPIRAFRFDLNSRPDVDEHKGGMVNVKMFNFVARDCFFPVFHDGVVVSTISLQQYIKDQDISLEMCACSCDDNVVDFGKIEKLLAESDRDIELKITTLKN